MNKKFVKINIKNKVIGHGRPAFIIAEAGLNHNGSLKLAKKLVDVAVRSGVDAVKFQTFTPELVVTKTAAQAKYQIKNTGKIESQLDMIKKLELSRSDHKLLVKYCDQKGIMFLSTPFSESDADFLETLGVPAYKTPSGEITNLPYLKHVAKKGKVMIVSTGMADMPEIMQAIKAIRGEGNNKIIILHCNSGYPPLPEDLNLNIITTFIHEFVPQGIPVGFSDNGTPGDLADIIARSLGACVIEKHYTLDKSMPGPDHKSSLDPEELKKMVNVIRSIEIMLGGFEKKCTPGEEDTKLVARRSIVAKREIVAGSKITLGDLIMKRPGIGISPAKLSQVVGKKTKRTIKEDEVITKSMLI